jgi:hypothetical protein
MIITLKKNDISFINELAKQRGKYYNSNWQQNKYRKGIANSDSDDYYIERLGLYGELTMSKILGIEIDKKIYDDGDPGYDFVYKNKKIDVKCQLYLPLDLYQNKKIYGEFYINATNQYGNIRNYKSDIIVFTSIESAKYLKDNKEIDISKKDFRLGKDKISDTINVKIHGYIYIKDILINKEERKNYRVDILRKNIIPKTKGNLYNFYIKENELKQLNIKKK